MSKKKKKSKEKPKADPLSVSQCIILDAYAELMDYNQFVWHEDLVERLKASKFREHWQRGDEWKQERLDADINDLLKRVCFVVESGAEEELFYMPISWDPDEWATKRSKKSKEGR